MFVIASKWHNPSVNFKTTLSIHDTIYQANNHRTLSLLSIDSLFTVNYVDHASGKSINPLFPAIHIESNSSCNKWLHAVYTDGDGHAGFPFIDGYDLMYPYYSTGSDFYDAPHWNYSLFRKPLTFWKGHAWAISIDEMKKEISVIGGIAWGFTFASPYSIYTASIVPTSLTKKDWLVDWERLFKKALPDYTYMN